MILHPLQHPDSTWSRNPCNSISTASNPVASRRKLSFLFSSFSFKNPSSLRWETNSRNGPAPHKLKPASERLLKTSEKGLPRRTSLPICKTERWRPFLHDDDRHADFERHHASGDVLRQNGSLIRRRRLAVFEKMGSKSKVGFAGWILIDRSGKQFATILNWLRDGDAPLPESRLEIEELKMEATFYLAEVIRRSFWALL